MKYYVEGQDFSVRLVPFPGYNTDGAITADEDGFISIFINSNVCLSRQLKALRHELEHMVRDDLFSSEPREVIEGRMHE